MREKKLMIINVNLEIKTQREWAAKVIFEGGYAIRSGSANAQRGELAAAGDELRQFYD